MQFEILNTIYWLVGFTFLAITYEVISKKFNKTFKRKYLYIGFVIATLITHQQFYTLTEKVDAQNTQEMFKRQSKTLQYNKTLDNYLENTENVLAEEVSSKPSLQELIKQEQLKSKELAEQIENK